MLRVEFLAEKKTEVLHGEGEFGVGLGRNVIEADFFEPARNMFESGLEREIFIRVSQDCEQSFHFIDLPPGFTDDLQCSSGFDSAGVDTLEKETLELATVIRAVGVNAATTAIKSGARL